LWPITGSTLYAIAANQGVEFSPTRRLIPYHEVDKTALGSHNIICVPCGDVNTVLPLAIAGFEMLSGVLCPAHHEPYDSSEAIRSEVSSTVFEKEFEAAYVTLFPNPWNAAKAFLVCGGNTGLGTQAALLWVLDAIAGNRPTPARSRLPYRIVRAKREFGSRVVTAQFEIE
jgi:hypothetical protein